MEILSAGTSGTSAERFFESLKRAGATSVVDIRLHRSSQLAGFAKERDLQFFVPTIAVADYLVEPLLAPADADLKAYRNKDLEWSDYESRYLDLIDRRRVAEKIEFQLWGARPVLLCSEPEPNHCHRRLAAEYLNEHLSGALSVTMVTHL